MILKNIVVKISCFVLNSSFILLFLYSEVHSRDRVVKTVEATIADIALRQAMRNSEFEEFIHQLSAGGDPSVWFDNTDKGWAFCASTEIGKEEYLKQIIAFGHDVSFRRDAIASNVSTPLFCALFSRNLEAVKILIEAGANPRARVCDTCERQIPTSALSLATINSSYDIAIWLIKNTEYREDQLQLVIRHLESSPFPIQSPQYLNRRQFVRELENKGYQVQLHGED